MVKGSVALSVRRRPVPLLSATTGRISGGGGRGPNCTKFGKDPHRAVTDVQEICFRFRMSLLAPFRSDAGTKASGVEN